MKARNIHSETPAYQGELNAGGPDLPTLLQVLGQLQGGQDTALAGYGRRLAGIPAKSFKLNTVFDADLESGDISRAGPGAGSAGHQRDGPRWMRGTCTATGERWKAA